MIKYLKIKTQCCIHRDLQEPVRFDVIAVSPYLHLALLWHHWLLASANKADILPQSNNCLHFSVNLDRMPKREKKMKRVTFKPRPVTIRKYCMSQRWKVKDSRGTQAKANSWFTSSWTEPLEPAAIGCIAGQSQHDVFPPENCIFKLITNQLRSHVSHFYHVKSEWKTAPGAPNKLIYTSDASVKPRSVRMIYNVACRKLRVRDRCGSSLRPIPLNFNQFHNSKCRQEKFDRSSMDHSLGGFKGSVTHYQYNAKLALGL